MLGEMHDEWDLPSRPVAIDSAYGDAAEFRAALDTRGYDYVAQVDPTATAQPGEAVPQAKPYTGRGRPPAPAYPVWPVTLREHALAVGQDACRAVTWRHGSKTVPDNSDAAMRSQFLALRIRPASRKIERDDDGSLPGRWLIADWPPDADEPVKNWLSNIDPNTPFETLVRLARSAGASNTTTAKSNTPSAWTTSKDAPSPTGAATSPSSYSPKPSARSFDSTQKRTRRPDHLRHRPCAATTPGMYGRYVPHLQAPLPRHELTKHY